MVIWWLCISSGVKPENLTLKVIFDQGSRSIAPQNNRHLNQGILHLWSKFGDSSLNGWQGWVSSGRNLFLPGHPEKSGRNLFLPVLSGQNWKKPDKTGKNCERCQKCWKNLWSYLISYKRLWLQMHLVNWYFLKTWCRKKNNLWPISSSFIWTKLEETGSQLGKL